MSTETIAYNVGMAICLLTALAVPGILAVTRRGGLGIAVAAMGILTAGAVSTAPTWVPLLTG